MNRQYAMYLAVLPKYRTHCIDILRNSLDADLQLFASSAHLDDTVKTGIPEEWYVRTEMIRVLKKFFIQYGSVSQALKSTNLVVDLNPRSLTSWFLLIARRLLKRRTLVWGHLNPKAGPSSPTARLRRQMRRLSSGTITYTYEDREEAKRQLPDQDVWVASNALYREQDIHPGESQGDRNSVLYVGRLEPSKKPGLLIDALPLLPAPIRLAIVGTGSELASMRERAAALGVSDRVDFHGWIDDVDRLRSIYSTAFCSVSPGFAGLGLTQSAGFGVPQIVSRWEQHSPEIELENVGAVHWFETDNAQSLADAVVAVHQDASNVPVRSLYEHVANTYSAEAMASGLANALLKETAG